MCISIYETQSGKQSIFCTFFYADVTFLIKYLNEKHSLSVLSRKHIFSSSNLTVSVHSFSNTKPEFKATHNVSAVIGQTTHLHCTVKNIGDRTVTDLVFNGILSKTERLFYIDNGILTFQTHNVSAVILQTTYTSSKRSFIYINGDIFI